MVQIDMRQARHASNLRRNRSLQVTMMLVGWEEYSGRMRCRVTTKGYSKREQCSRSYHSKRFELSKLPPLRRYRPRKFVEIDSQAPCMHDKMLKVTFVRIVRWSPENFDEKLQHSFYLRSPVRYCNEFGRVPVNLLLCNSISAEVHTKVERRKDEVKSKRAGHEECRENQSCTYLECADHQIYPAVSPQADYVPSTVTLSK